MTTAINLFADNMLGQQFETDNFILRGSTVIASGYYRDDIVSLMVLLAPNQRLGADSNYANYGIFFVNLVTLGVTDTGERRANVPYGLQTFKNIVPTVQCWADEYGMDY